MKRKEKSPTPGPSPKERGGRMRMVATMLMLLLALATMLLQTIQGQKTKIEDNIPAYDSSIATYMNAIYEDFDSTIVYSGFLVDKAIPFVNLNNYNGKQNSKQISKYSWRNIYHHLYMSQVVQLIPKDIDSLINTLTLPVISEFANDNKKAINNEDIIPIAIIDMQYQKLNPSLIKNNKVYFVNNKLNRASVKKTDTLLIAEKVFTFTALNDKLYNGESVRFYFDEKLFFTNLKKTEFDYEIDFDDGFSFRKVEFGEIIEVNYNNEGPKKLTIRKTERIKTSKLKSSTDFSTNEEIAYASLQIANLTIPLPNDYINLNVYVPLNYPFGDNYIGGTAYVYTSDGSKNIKNPIIVSEGFDPLSENELYVLYTMLNQQNMLEILRSNGFDIIILNLHEGGTYIQRNAWLFKSLVQEVNRRKALTGSLNRNIILGPSMGGLVTHYALSYMEKNGIDHESRLYISFDAPHKGANIPLGVQFWIKFFAEHSLNSAAVGFWYLQIQSPASRQMSFYNPYKLLNTTDIDDPVRAEFITSLANIGYPQNLKKVAAANGSGNGTWQKKNNGNVLNYSDQIIDYNYSSTLLDIKGNSYAMANYQNNKRIFKGLFNPIGPVNIEWDVFSSSNLPPLDNCPGGTYHSTKTIDETEVDYGNPSSNVHYTSFIPTISALDVNTSNYFYNVKADPNILNKTPFEDIYYFEDYNEKHVWITDGLRDWFLNQIVPNRVVIDANNNNYMNKGTIRAGSSIVLKPGAKATRGSKFKTALGAVALTSSLKSARIAESPAYHANDIDALQTDLPEYMPTAVNTVVSVQPNPCTTVINIQSNVLIKSMELYNLNGKLVKSETAFNLFNSINVENLSKGIYVLKVFTEKEMKQFKIVKL